MNYRELDDESSPDGEILLGNGKLTAIFLATALICGTCFGLGYSLGRHTAAKAAETDAPSLAAPAPAYATEAKPSPESARGPSASATNAAQPASEDATIETVVAPPRPGKAPRTAPPPDAVHSSGAARNSALASAPATAANGAYVVQVAAISRQSDADVLAAALRRKGYAVSSVANPKDHLVHVQVGPFNTPADAQAMRDHLSSDGYLAIIK